MIEAVVIWRIADGEVMKIEKWQNTNEMELDISACASMQQAGEQAWSYVRFCMVRRSERGHLVPVHFVPLC